MVHRAVASRGASSNGHGCSPTTALAAICSSVLKHQSALSKSLDYTKQVRPPRSRLLLLLLPIARSLLSAPQVRSPR